MAHPEFSCLKNWGGDHDNDGTPNWRDGDFWSGPDSCSAPWAMEEEFDYTNPDQDMDLQIDSGVETEKATAIVKYYLKEELGQDDSYIEDVVEKLVGNHADVDGVYGDDFFKLFYGEYEPNQGWSETPQVLLEPPPTKSDFDEILELTHQNAIEASAQIAEAEVFEAALDTAENIPENLKPLFEYIYENKEGELKDWVEFFVGTGSFPADEKYCMYNGNVSVRTDVPEGHIGGRANGEEVYDLGGNAITGLFDTELSLSLIENPDDITGLEIMVDVFQKETIDTCNSMESGTSSIAYDHYDEKGNQDGNRFSSEEKDSIWEEARGRIQDGSVTWMKDAQEIDRFRAFFPEKMGGLSSEDIIEHMKNGWLQDPEGLVAINYNGTKISLSNAEIDLMIINALSENGYINPGGIEDVLTVMYGQYRNK